MSQQHILKRFDSDLEDLRSGVLAMGGLVEQQFLRAMEGLERGDIAALEQIIENDHLVNRREVELDELCTQIVARLQPAAVDLRLVMTVVKIITDLERIGDEAKKIPKWRASYIRVISVRYRASTCVRPPILPSPC